ncbi:MAG: hypothetical protein M1828_000861 [Chrysothrix sp. TS-e1954]|nr:MAG: hypothetical protein M1828_000861 [Chrysothrix sp. TS-e1954]
MRASFVHCLVTASSCFNLLSGTALGFAGPREGLSSRNNSNPCAKLSSQSAASSAAHKSAQQIDYRPSLVLECFHDIPINKSLSVELIRWIQSFVQFQTTLAWLKDPPSSYPRPPIDIVQSLDDIALRVDRGLYADEYDFEVDIMATVYAAHDLHFAFQPYLPAVLSSRTISRKSPLVSISLDGQQLPKPYLLSDVEAIYSNGSFTPSAVTSLDGQSPTEFFDRILQFNPSFTDPDAAYNALFVNPVPLILDTAGLFSAGFDPTLRDNTTYTFANGSHICVENMISLPPFSNEFSSGQDLYTALLLEPPTPTPTSQAATQSVTATAASTPPPQPLFSGYPTPIVAQLAAPSEQAISGYFLPQSDVAILSLTSMDYFGIQGDSDFQRVARTFLRMCKETRKAHLLIDVRRNIGGQPAVVWDLFRQLFPGQVPFTRIRTRANAATNALGILTSQLQDGFPPHANASTRELLVSSNTSFFNYHVDLKAPDGPPFESWPELFGPVTSHGDNFTKTASWPMNDPSYTESEFDMVVSGYGNLSDVPASPFSPDQITIPSDGLCSSGCADFVRLLVDQGVKTVVVGGRPSMDSMRVIGGTQGGIEVPFTDIAELAEVAIGIAKAQNLSAEVLEPLTRSIPIQQGAAGQSRVNLLDNIGKDDDTLTPLQFTRWLADCRMFYIPKDIVDAQYTWQRVAKGIASGGQGLCVQGSLGGTKHVHSNATI